LDRVVVAADGLPVPEETATSVAAEAVVEWEAEPVREEPVALADPHTVS